MEQRNKAQWLGIGESRDEEAQKIHTREGWCEILYFPLFLASPVLIIKKPKLNQTKINLKQVINKTKRYGLASL